MRGCGEDVEERTSVSPPLFWMACEYCGGSILTRSIIIKSKEKLTVKMRDEESRIVIQDKVKG